MSNYMQAKQKYPIGTPVEVRINGTWHPATVYDHAGDYVIARTAGNGNDEYAGEDVRPALTLEHGNTCWNGEGLPPVGTRCEVIVGSYWYECEVIGQTDGALWVKSDHDDYWTIHSESSFRPIRSERERWVEAAHKIANDDSGSATFRAIGAVYDSIKSGKLKAPE